MFAVLWRLNLEATRQVRTARIVNVARAVGVVKPANGIDAQWISICLRSPLSQHLFGSRANTTVQTTINLKDVRALPIPIPPKAERSNIASFIATLDDRIALLRETNATLEAIAQALFKSWFVDFDPVRAKQQELVPVGMDEATAALFPSALEATDRGLIPNGWGYVGLREVVSIFDSKRIPLSAHERAKRKGSFPYYGAAALMDHIDAYLFHGVYVLMGEDGSVTQADGRPVLQYVWGKFWVNNHAHVLQGSNGISTEHVLLALREMNIGHLVTGAVQAKLSQANMWRIDFLRPSPEVGQAFSAVLEPLFAKVRQNAEQARELVELRDILLPRLISGQLRLSEAEAVVL